MLCQSYQYQELPVWQISGFIGRLRQFWPPYDCYGHIIDDLVAGRACAHSCLKPDTCYRVWETAPLAPRGYVSLDTFARRLIFGFPCLSLKLKLSLSLSPCLPSGLYCLLPKNQLPLGCVVFLPICLCVPARIESRHQTSVYVGLTCLDTMLKCNDILQIIKY